MTETHAGMGATHRGSPKRVLIVDDSRVMRAWLRGVLSDDPRLQIVGEAEDAVAARDFLRAHGADVLTLDIEMPGMSGLEFLTRLMRARPMPVVMMSSLTSAGSDAAVQALSRGAIDCMAKPSSGFTDELKADICERVFQASCTRPMQTRTPDAAVPPRPQPAVSHSSEYGTRLKPCRRGSLFVIGASTGGVAALETVLSMLDPQGPPVMIVQHMPGNFLISFTERLNRQLQQTVKLAHEGMTLNRGDIVLAPGEGQHTELRKRNGAWVCHHSANDPPALHCPSVDTMFLSVVEHAKDITASILTGLGKDGANGLLQLANGGARTFGQDEETCVVYGMPRAAKAIGAVQRELPLESIGPAMRAGKKQSFADAVTARPVGL